MKGVAALITDMKLKHFEAVCMEEAKRDFDAAISDYTAHQETLFEEHKRNAREQARIYIQEETEKLRRQMNRELSVNQLAIRRSYGETQEALRKKLFSELRERLRRFMETPEYTRLLEKQIRKAKEFTGDEEMILYLDPADQEKQDSLSGATGCNIRISQYSFFGGTRAVIPAKNILIDNSFETKLKEAEDNFQFAIGGKQNGSIG